MGFLLLVLFILSVYFPVYTTSICKNVYSLLVDLPLLETRKLRTSWAEYGVRRTDICTRGIVMLSNLLVQCLLLLIGIDRLVLVAGHRGVIGGVERLLVGILFGESGGD